MAIRTPSLLLITIALVLFAAPSEAFGAGYVSRGSHLKGARFRHGDIALAIPLLACANRRIVKQIYFGNWLRDFSQLLDNGTLSVVPRPILRALVAIFAFVQFGYSTREFEVTDERLGLYRPEEHVDNPKGYGGSSNDAHSTNGLPAQSKAPAQRTEDSLRPPVQPLELDIDSSTGMKNYVANSMNSPELSLTSADYVRKQLIAAIACGRAGSVEAYTHLGAALHPLEDFLAHSNYVELALQMIGQDIHDQSLFTPALRRVFAFVGDNARVKTARGEAPPLTTGTFGALDLCQTLLGEIEDKVGAVSLPGLRVRMPDVGGALEAMAKSLIGVLGPLTPNFELDILKIQKAAAKAQSASWGKLQEKPEKLWESVEPVLKLRDDVAKWINDHLKVRVVQDALASISTIIDKFVFMVLGIFLSPVLSELTKVLKDQEQRLLLADQQARRKEGEHSIFDAGSTNTDPTHSQLAKDHYDHALNEIAGRIAVSVSTYTTSAIVRLWPPGNTEDPQETIQSILEAFHHPCNASSGSAVQSLMIDEVRSWIKESLSSDSDTFEATLKSLSATAVASRMDVHAQNSGGHTHVDPGEMEKIGSNGEQHSRGFTERMCENIKRQLKDGQIKDVSIEDLPMIKKLLLADPSDDSPNPLDNGLSKIPGLNFVSTFEGIEVHEIAAIEGMGETLKDAVVTMILLDEVQGAEAEAIASRKMAWGKGVEEEEAKAKLKELKSMLEIQKTETRQEEGQFDDKVSFGDRMKLGAQKLKLKAKG